jgi:hypothetical protein
MALQMRRRLWPLLPAALIIIVLLLYPSTQCKVTGIDLTMSQPETFVIPTKDGYAVGFSFNVTNQAACAVTAQKIHVLLRSLVYPDGTQDTVNTEETETVGGTLTPGQSGLFSHTFDSYFSYRPAKLVLRVEMTFAETGPVLVFDGELDVSA